MKVIDSKTEPKHARIERVKQHIDLEQLLHTEEHRKNITFNGVPKSSFLTIDKRIDGEDPEYHENLIEVTVRHETYIYNITDNKIEEIVFFHNMNELNDPE